MIFPDKLDVLDNSCEIDRRHRRYARPQRRSPLESALTAPRNRHYYETADVVSCAATYAFHITQTQAFVDGKKGVAAAVTETFLETNGFELGMTNEEIAGLFLAVASNTLTREQTEQLFRDKVRPKH